MLKSDSAPYQLWPLSKSPPFLTLMPLHAFLSYKKVDKTQYCETICKALCGSEYYASPPLTDLHLNASQGVCVPTPHPRLGHDARSLDVLNSALGFVYGEGGVTLPISPIVLSNDLLRGNFPSQRCFITFREHQLAPISHPLVGMASISRQQG